MYMYMYIVDKYTNKIHISTLLASSFLPSASLINMIVDGRYGCTFTHTLYVVDIMDAPTCTHVHVHVHVDCRYGCTHTCTCM